MVGLGAARWVSDQARIFESWRVSSWPKALSKNLAWRCQDGSLVSGISGELAEGCMPARNFAVSSGVTSADRAGKCESQNEGSGERGSFERHDLSHLRLSDAAAWVLRACLRKKA